MIGSDCSSPGPGANATRIDPDGRLTGDRSLALGETDDFPALVDEALGDFEFALCLTHDVDRPYKRHQALFYALTERSPSHLRSLAPGVNPYWQFEEVAALEADLGVRSAFYFLQEPNLVRDRPIGEWFDPGSWIQFLGRYDVSAPDIARVVGDLDDGGWEIGLHASIPAHAERDRLREEKETLEAVLGRPVLGGRQHYLRLDGRETWRRQTDVGLRYDASLGSSTEYGFENGYLPRRPFDDEFVVFPLTVMEQTLPDVDDDDTDEAERVCERLLAEAAANDAVASALWHPRYFNEDEFPGYRRVYRSLVERALEMGAWVGPTGRFYERLVDVASKQTA